MSSLAVERAEGARPGSGTGGFAVITVVRNNLVGLKKTHECLVKQTDRDFTWLVMDGLSTDGTREWLRSLRMEGLKYVSEKDNSLFDAMNKAVAKLDSGYFIFLNSGDFFWDDRVVERIRNTIRESAFEFGYGQYMMGGVPGFPTRLGGRKIESTWEIFLGRIPCHQASVISKDAFIEMGGYREDLGIYGDREWMLRYVKKHPPSEFAYMPFVIAYYDPDGLSYHRFFRYSKNYLKMHWLNGNPFEFVLGMLGWCKTALYIFVSGMLRSRKAGRQPGIGKG